MYKLFILAILLTSCAAGYNAPQAPLQQVASLEQPQPEQLVDNDEFYSWLEGFKAKAIRNGIAPATVKSALKIAKPIEKVIRLDKKQPEHKVTMEEYLANVINDARIEKGRDLFAENEELLNQISAKTGVEPEFILALWGLETGYGKNTGGFNVVSSLATLAYEGRRRDFFESELMSALLIIDQGHVTAADMRGSWAGAMGQNQFMPSSFLAYAVDYDGDGKADIWNNKKDVLASIANYLRTVGWSKDAAVKQKTLMHWNRSTYFVASVFKLAQEIKDES